MGPPASPGVTLFETKIRRYALAAFAVAAAAIIQRQLWPLIPPSPQLFFYPAVFLVARVAGLGPAIFSMALSLPVMTRWFLPPYDSFLVERPDDIVDLALYAVMAVVLAVLVDRVKRAETKARVAIDAAPSPTALLAREGRIVYANAAFCEALDRPSSILVGQSLADLAHPDAAAKLRAKIASADHGERLETRLLRKDGHAMWIEGMISRVHGDGGARFLVQFLDVTSRRDAERERERVSSQLHAVVQECPVGLIILRENGRVVEANPAGRAIYGSQLPTRMDEGGPDILDRHGVPIPLDERPAVRALRGERVTGMEMQFRRADGLLVPLLVNAAPMGAAGGADGSAVVVFQDISPIKELEQLRLQWSAVVAHDLRQPIDSIILRADNLARNRTAPEKDVQALFRATRRLNSMVQDLLDASRLEIRQMPLARDAVDLVVFISDRIEAARYEMPERQFDLDVRDRELVAWADPDRLMQIFDNILGNALKYGLPGAPIRVEVGRAGPCEGVYVAVTNEGDGIASDDIPRIFDRYRRTEAAIKRGIKGTGLGLYIVRELLLAHGGDIGCESTGGLTTFRFVLPPVAPPEEAKAATA